jgi:hypothetical protein
MRANLETARHYVVYRRKMTLGKPLDDEMFINSNLPASGQIQKAGSRQNTDFARKRRTNAITSRHARLFGCRTSPQSRPIPSECHVPAPTPNGLTAQELPADFVARCGLAFDQRDASPLAGERDQSATPAPRMRTSSCTRKSAARARGASGFILTAHSRRPSSTTGGELAPVEAEVDDKQ